jgi:ATP-dependent 26S proteasome regulatory subunit
MALKPIPLDPSLRGGQGVPALPAATLPPYLPAGSVPYPGLIKYKALEKAVRAFLWRQKLPALKQEAPRAILVYGVPSTGKTKSLCNYLCATAGMHVVVVPAHTLAATHEAEHTDRLTAILQGAQALAHASGIDVAVLIDDVDAIFSVDARTTKTQNNDIARVFLQHLQDSKHLYTQRDGRPIPLLYSANSMADAHLATFREGRCTVYHHEPTPAERAAVIAAHLRPKTLCERAVVARLARKYPHVALATFAQISSAIDTQRLDALLDQTDDVATLERELAKPRALTPRNTLRVARDIVAARATAFAPAKSKKGT